MPCHRCDRVIVTYQRVQLGFEVPQVPNAYSLVCGSCCQHIFWGWIEWQGIDCIWMPINRSCRWRCRRGIAHIKDLESQVIWDGTNEWSVWRMILNIIYNGGMVRVSSSSMDCFVVGRKFCYVPTVVSGWELLKMRLPTIIAPSYLHFQ